MKGRAKGKARGRYRLSRKGEINCLRDPFRFSGKYVMQRPVVVGDKELIGVQVPADFLNRVKGKADDAGHSSLAAVALFLQEFSDGLRKDQTVFEGNCLRGGQGRVHPMLCSAITVGTQPASRRR